MKFTNVYSTVDGKTIMVAGKELAALALAAHEAGDFRIRADVGKNGDTNGLRREHEAHREERTAAITYVMNTGKPALDILAKWKPERCAA
jgi:hypothetical protein